MIDEWYDRTYLECRAEMNAAVLRLLTSAARAIRKPETHPAGDMPCAPELPSSSPRAR